MEERKFLTKLRDFGLNTYETKLWVALLSGGVSTAGELSSVANIPRSRSYDVLESLRKKGFVFVEQKKPIKYKAIPPEIVIKNTKEKVRERVKKQIKLIDNLKTRDLFKELEKIYKQSSELEPNEFVGVFKDKTNTKNQLQCMITHAENFVYITETTKGLKSNIDFLIKILPVLEKKGVDVRVMVNVDKDFDDKFNKIKIKNTKLRNRFYVVDGKEMLFMLFDDYDAGVLLNTKSFIKSIANLFNKKWANSDFVD